MIGLVIANNEEQCTECEAIIQPGDKCLEDQYGDPICEECAERQEARLEDHEAGEL
jgi:hypothetical protein